MKIKIKSFTKLKALKERIGLSSDYKPNFELKNTWNTISPEDWDLLNTKGAEAKLSEIQVDDNRTLNWKGHKVVLHIYSVRDNGSHGMSLPKFHVSFCSVLNGMKQRGSYERYVVSQRTTGDFTINIRGSEKEEALDVCRVCLSELNYQTYNQLSNPNKNKIVTGFKIPEFFKFYHHGFYNVPNYTDKTAKYDDYVPNWKEISAEIRWNCHWKCEKCKLDLSRDKKYLHVHHKNHIRSDNSPSNLAALCIECHAKEPNHGHIRNLKDYRGFQDNYIKKRAA